MRWELVHVRGIPLIGVLRTSSSCSVAACPASFYSEALIYLPQHYPQHAGVLCGGKADAQNHLADLLSSPARRVARPALSVPE